MNFIPGEPNRQLIVGGGKEHTRGMGPHITPLSVDMSPMSFKSRSMFSPKATRATDITRNEDDVLDLSEVNPQIPFKVPQQIDSFTFTQSDFMFVVDPNNTIKGSSSAFYDVRGPAFLNDYLRRIHHEGYARRLVKSDVSFTAHAEATDPNISLTGGPFVKEPLNMSFMNINTIAEKIFFIGFAKSVYTQGRTDGAMITKNAGGSLAAYVAEGRIEAPNVWNNVTVGSHVGFALTKYDPIDKTDPFKERPHQIIPVTCSNGIGFGLYPQFGVEVYDTSSFSTTKKRARMDSQIMLGAGMKRENTDAWVGSYSSQLQAGKYHPNSLIINADKYRHKTVDGTVFSLDRHEAASRIVKVAGIPNARSVPDVFLDWSNTKFDIKHTNPDTTGSSQTKDVYGANIWMITMVQAFHYPVGVVSTSGRGGKPSPALIGDAIVNDDYDQGAEALNTLWEKNKVTIICRTQN
jgi:hypothetical protein